MSVLLGLFAAFSYGASDFFAGLGSRRFAAGPVTALAQVFAVLVAVIGVVLLPGAGPDAAVLGWGAFAGVGSAVGTFSLYRGLSTGAMSPVATCSAVLAATVPAVVGLATGDHLSVLAAVGIAVALPAIALVSWQGDEAVGGGLAAGIGYGLVAGVGFGVLFVGLDQAGSAAGAWPLLASTVTAAVLVAPFAVGAGPARAWRPVVGLCVAAGVLGASSNLLFIRAAGVGQLTVVAVLASLYPVTTVLLARFVLAERWTRLQAVGLVVSAGAVALISLG